MFISATARGCASFNWQA